MKNKLPWILLLATFLIAAKITTDNFKIGRKTAEDISIEFDKGLGTSNPQILWDNAADKLKFTNDGTNLFEFGSGSGSGEVNYIDNFNFETDTSGWSTYVDAAGSSPVDGTGGGTANISITAQSSTILRGGKSLQLVKDAADRQGEGFSYDFTIKEQDINKKLKLQFDFKSDEDAAYANGDVTVWIYDVTNATLITPVDTDLPRGTNIFQTSFVSTASTSYRLIFHIATTNASAYDVYIDDVIVGPGKVSQGAAIGSPIPYTPTITGGGKADTAWTINNAIYQRVGNKMKIGVSATINSLGVGANAALKITLPSGFTVDTANLGEWKSDLVSTIGTAFANIAAGAPFYLGNATYDATENNIQVIDGPNVWVGNLPAAWANGDSVNIQVELPILEWQGSGIVPMLSEDNLSEWQDAGNLTWSGNTPARSTEDIVYRRVGDTLEIKGSVVFSANGTAGTFYFDLPFGYTFDNTKITGTPTSSQMCALGFGGKFDSSAVDNRSYCIAQNDSTRQVAFSNTTSGSGGFVPGTNLDVNDQLNFYAFVPIVEFSGSQNSLVGYSEAEFNFLGLTKKNRAQVRILGSDITAPTVDISDLRLVNLTIGKVYKLSISAKQGTTGTGATESFALKANHNGSVIVEDRIRYGNKPSGLFENTNGNSVIFTATATSITFDWEETGTGELAGNGTTQETFVMIEELNNYEALTTAFSP